MPSPRRPKAATSPGITRTPSMASSPTQMVCPTHLRLRNPWAMDGYSGTTDGANDGYITITAQQASASMLGFVSAAV